MQRTYRYLDVIGAAFVTTLLCANLIGAQKIFLIGDFKLGGAVIFFPISYIFGDILTEVYGYARSRRVVWLGFAAMLFASIVSAVVIALPPADMEQQRIVAYVFGQTWRILLASLSAYFVGEFVNSYLLARMKVATTGKHLWLRTIGSTIVGEAIDSMLFYPLAFLGVWSLDLVLSVAASSDLLKVVVEVAMTPVTYWVVAKLKRAESEDFFDAETNFTPFRFKG
jgi:uncharacterized integral membrane protein (TIGR00697 family)